ncbi:hypothetical protein [Bacteriovorax sp. DB6_IX]|uniref:hypothetical protein n=1 Tax=Bacteriovorax sp. DB6_IX TaxID=1353530 RepID=UPI000389ECB2|nr:hypothetical protein [Bacteriovorax sp. DB6_IX]EQC51477.1 hypothetical protein M901_2333 [Bacteriovorax sp. DB6_IX]
MKKLILLLLIPFISFANADLAKTIMNEYQDFREMVSNLKEDRLVGDYYKAKQYPDVLLLWNLRDDINDHEVIRFFRYREDGTPFAVTYHRSSYIVDGRIVLRRFVGPEPSGWENHTIDYLTGEYLGRQGFDPYLSKDEKQFLIDWNIKH